MIFYKNLIKFVLSKMTKKTLFEIIETIERLVDTTKWIHYIYIVPKCHHLRLSIPMLNLIIILLFVMHCWFDICVFIINSCHIIMILKINLIMKIMWDLNLHLFNHNLKPLPFWPTFQNIRRYVYFDFHTL